MKQPEIMSTIASRLSAARKNKNWTQDELFENSGVSRETIAKIESGTTRQPREDNIKSLSNALGVTSAYLQYGVADLSSVSPDVREAIIALERLPQENRKPIIETIKMVADLATAQLAETSN